MKYINEAGWDRIGRVGLGVVLLALGWGGVVTGAFGMDASSGVVMTSSSDT